MFGKILMPRTMVTRVTLGKSAGLVSADYLAVGDEFTLNDERFQVTLKTGKLQASSTGDRVEYNGHWYAVLRMGEEIHLFCCKVPQHPFSSSEKEKAELRLSGVADVQYVTICKVPDTTMAGGLSGITVAGEGTPHRISTA